MGLKEKYKRCLDKLNRKKNSKIEFQFISENPISGGKENPLSFGHERIVDTLKTIISNSPESFTIGLYGDWGSGKSTIISSLQNELKQNQIPLVLFDVWKHEGDALRRTFLNTVVGDMKSNYDKSYFNEEFKLDNRNFNSTSITEEFQTILKERLGLHLLIVLLFSCFILLPFFIFWVVLKYIFGWDFLDSPLGQSIGGIFSLSLLPFFYKYIDQFIKTKKETKTQDRFKDPHEFESEFKRILKNGILKKKLVIAFDNLDRVGGEKAIEIMSTIKTFLDPVDEEVENVDVVFIIPCDESAIKRHLRNTLSYSKDFRGDDYHNYAGEYLRKFFNTIIWIPEFYINELEDLASEKLRETKIKDFENEELAALIVQAFDKNPRQIIQFINILISNYLLVSQRLIEGFSLSKDIAKLAKYLLLIQRFPDIMETYRRSMIYQLEETPIELDKTNVDGTRNFSEKRVADFHDFLKLTEHVKIESLDQFFKLRTNKFERKLENSSRVIKIIEANKISELIQYKELASEEQNNKSFTEDLNFLQNVDIQNKQHEFSQVVNEKLHRINNPVLLANFVDGLLHFNKFKELTLNDTTYRMIYNKLNLHSSYLSTIDPSNLISEFYDKMVSDSDKARLKQLINKQQTQDFVYSFLD